MKILHIAPPWESVPPPAYGGTEAVVHLLVEEQVRRGHNVALAAAGDSQTSARLISSFGRGLRTAGVADDTPYVWAHASLALQHAAEFDIIHNHAGEELMSLAPLVPGVPMLTTTHCNLTPDRQRIWDQYAGYYNTISWSQARTLPGFPKARFAGVAYNAIDVESFPFQREKEDHLLFLGRMAQEKGAHIAIEVARRAGKRLVMAGKVDPVDKAYFDSMVAPHVDGDRVTYLGEANAAQKRELFRKAAAVLMPIVWEEPFGLVMAEAQACGTPVLVFDRGAAAEIVRDGETGFVLDNADEMVAAIDRIGEIEPAACRNWVASRFDTPHMTDRYLHLYEQIAGKPTEKQALDTVLPTAFAATTLPRQEPAPDWVT